MENLDNVVHVEFPALTDEEREEEYAAAQASVAYSELSVIYRAEQSLRLIVNSKNWESVAFQQRAHQLGIWEHLNQFRV